MARDIDRAETETGDSTRQKADTEGARYETQKDIIKSTAKDLPQHLPSTATLTVLRSCKVS